MVHPRPEPAPAARWEYPTPARSTLPNGAQLLVYRLPGQHVVSTRVAIPARLADEPREREGVATLVSRTMDEGTERHTGEEMAELLERNGIGLSASAGEGGITMELESVSAQFGTGLELLTEALSVPVFDEAEVRRHQRSRLADIEQIRAQAGGRAAIEWIAARYADSARASRPTGGSAATVAQIGAQDCRDFHAAHVRPDAATLVVAGDLDPAAVHDTVADSFGQWTVSQADPVAATPVPVPGRAHDAQRVVFVDRPGAVQSELYLGTAGPSRHVAGGWAPYPVLSHVLGGGPNARIDAVLREEKGYTYGVRASFRPRLGYGEFVVSGSVRADVTAEALELLLEVLEGAAAEGFTDDEVTSAVDYVGKTAPGRYATADVVADVAAMLVPDGLGTDFITTYLDGLRGLNAATLHEAWRAACGDWSIVVVGDAEQHLDGVRALGRGEVTVLK
ncbi:M16 family metallopeptidase [Dermacoccaceae bacterium W4C1]